MAFADDDHMQHVRELQTHDLVESVVYVHHSLADVLVQACMLASVRAT